MAQISYFTVVESNLSNNNSNCVFVFYMNVSIVIFESCIPSLQLGLFFYFITIDILGDGGV